MRNKSVSRIESIIHDYWHQEIYPARKRISQFTSVSDNIGGNIFLDPGLVWVTQIYYQHLDRSPFPTALLRNASQSWHVYLRNSLCYQIPALLILQPHSNPSMPWMNTWGLLILVIQHVPRDKLNNINHLFAFSQPAPCLSILSSTKHSSTHFLVCSFWTPPLLILQANQRTHNAFFPYVTHCTSDFST